MKKEHETGGAEQGSVSRKRSRSRTITRTKCGLLGKGGGRIRTLWAKTRILESKEGTSQMPYNNNPQTVQLTLAAVYEHDYVRANPGQWFYGAVDTTSGQIYLVPGDVHADPRNELNLNERMRNTYASKPPVPFPGWHSLVNGGSQHEIQNGIGGVPGQTGHMRIMQLMQIPQDRVGDFVGFRLIKTCPGIATFSDRSNSLNNRPGQQRITGPVTPGPGGWMPSGVARMPEQWRDATIAHLRQHLAINNLAVDS